MMIEIDGSEGEGGGQILRTSLALSMCTGKPFRLHNIRAERSKPGLMRQHLACVHAARDVCNANVSGDTLGATELCFEPGAVNGGMFEFAIAGAGSTMLVLQTVLPALLGANTVSTLRLSGGTHNPMAPSFHFIERAFAPWVERVGGRLQLELRRFGFYPAGGGEVQAFIAPVNTGATCKPICALDRGTFVATRAHALIAGISTRVAEHELRELARELDWTDDQCTSQPLSQNEGPGNALIATLEYERTVEVFCELGERNISAEIVAGRLAAQVRAYQQGSAPIGAHLADQLMLLLAVSVGGQYAVTEVTEHTRTNARVIERFLPNTVTIAEYADGTGIVTVANA